MAEWLAVKSVEGEGTQYLNLRQVVRFFIESSREPEVHSVIAVTAEEKFDARREGSPFGPGSKFVKVNVAEFQSAEDAENAIELALRDSRDVTEIDSRTKPTLTTGPNPFYDN